MFYETIKNKENETWGGRSKNHQNKEVNILFQSRLRPRTIFSFGQ